MRIHEIAKKYKIPSKDMVAICTSLGMRSKKAVSTLSDQEYNRLESYIQALIERKRPAHAAPAAPPAAKKTARKEKKAGKEKKGEKDTEAGKTAAKKTAKKTAAPAARKTAPPRGKTTASVAESVPATREPAPKPPAEQPAPAVPAGKASAAAPGPAPTPPVPPPTHPPSPPVQKPAAPSKPTDQPAPAPADRTAHGIPQPVLEQTSRPVAPVVRPPKKALSGQPAVTVPQPPPVQAPVQDRPLSLRGDETVSQLASKMGIPAAKILGKLLEQKVLANINQQLPLDAIRRICAAFHFIPEIQVDSPALVEEEAEIPERLKPRAPVVTIMGHVDHGKTTILDVIRKSRVAQKEYGQITQSIGAYRVDLPQGSIVFLDTPGHEAFTAMRARGTQVTDIVILVVAADEGIKPQTIEAINHAKSAKIPIVVAINKIDRPNANPDRVIQQLAEHNLVPEQWGGDTVCARVSGLTGEGIPELLEMTLLVGEMLELRANPDRPARGTVIESRLHRAKGPVITVLVQDGTLRTGDLFVAGKAWGRARAILDDNERRISKAGPSTPVEILGISEVVPPGTKFRAVRDEREARTLTGQWEQSHRKGEAAPPPKLTLEALFRSEQDGNLKELKLVLKTDSIGSLEAIRNSLERIPSREVRLSMVHAGTGAISESDILLAAAAGGIVLGFNVPFESKAVEIAKSEGVEVKVYRIIYDLLDEIHNCLEGLLEPVRKEEITGQAQVRKVFSLSNNLSIAGCMVVEGKVVRDSRARVIREGRSVFEGFIGSLRRFKDSVREVAANTECGIALTNFRDFREGDIIQSYVIHQIRRKLGSGTDGPAGRRPEQPAER